MERNEWMWVIGVVLVVAVIASVTTVRLTGNAITVASSPLGYKVYTTTEMDLKLRNYFYNKSDVDGKLANLKGTCQYIHYKDNIYTGHNLSAMSVMDVCQNILGGFVPKVITQTETLILHNKQDCSPSYQIYGKTSDELISYKTELAGIKLGQSTSNACENALFPDGSINGNFSSKRYRLYSGVLCCRN
jgi:hypothetical protein